MKYTEKLIRFGALFCALVMMLLAFAACTPQTPQSGGENTDNSSEVTEGESTSATPSANALPLNDGKKGLFTIVRPDESDQGMYEQAKGKICL